MRKKICVLLAAGAVAMGLGSAVSASWFWDSADDSVRDYLSQLDDDDSSYGSRDDDDDGRDDDDDSRDDDHDGDDSGYDSRDDDGAHSGGCSGGDENVHEYETEPDEDGWYYDVDSVVLYLDEYDELPSNYITKKEAKKLGWEGGSVERYRDGAAIGGDKFGNYEEILPVKKGRQYYEADIDTDGAKSRGAKRLIFNTDDDLYFYTDDHYETFTELTVDDCSVIYGDLYE